MGPPKRINTVEKINKALVGKPVVVRTIHAVFLGVCEEFSAPNHVLLSPAVTLLIDNIDDFAMLVDPAGIDSHIVERLLESGTKLMQVVVVTNALDISVIPTDNWEKFKCVTTL